MQTLTTVKKTSRAFRIWLENKSNLEKAGFIAGARYEAEFHDGEIVLTLSDNGRYRVSCCKRGESIRPIIDIHSKSVALSFEAGIPVIADFEAGKITIVRA